jgi:hypothetical protein
MGKSFDNDNIFYRKVGSLFRVHNSAAMWRKTETFGVDAKEITRFGTENACFCVEKDEPYRQL